MNSNTQDNSTGENPALAGLAQFLPVRISFDCIPLRSVNRLDAPLDAPVPIKQKCQRIGTAVAKHGRHNTYYLHNAVCVFQLTNNPNVGVLEFAVEGVVLADENDCRTTGVDLSIELVKETCEWLTDPVVAWFQETVCRAVMAEFDRYMAAGDLAKTAERIRQLQSTVDASAGYVGMYL